MSQCSTDLVVHNARVVTESGVRYGGVAVEDGTIVAVGRNGSLPAGDREIDADGNFLLPGLVDPHVHIGRRDFPYEEGLATDFETETRGAVHGGVTCLLNFLEHGDDYVPNMDFYREVGEDNSYIDFGHHVVLSHDHHFDEIRTLAQEEGISSFKLFFNMYKYTDVDMEHADVDRVYRLLETLSDLPNTIGMFHCENAEVHREAKQRVKAEGRHNLAAWADASPNIAESMQIEQLATLTDHLDARTYAVHVSTAEGVDALARRQAEGVQIAGEALVAHLVATKEEDLGVWGKVSPPLRGERSQERLWEGLRTGTLQHVGTDHITTSKEGREMGEGKHGEHMWEAPPGVQPGMEVMLPMLLTEGYNRNRIGIERLVEVAATNNAKRFNLYPDKGVIQEGADADLVIADPDRTAVIDDDFYHGREPRWSPYHGRELRGLATHTVVGGELAVREGELLVDPGRGSFRYR
jgi:dihydropyrimidinase/dihydroorotase